MPLSLFSSVKHSYAFGLKKFLKLGELKVNERISMDILGPHAAWQIDQKMGVREADFHFKNSVTLSWGVFPSVD